MTMVINNHYKDSLLVKLIALQGQVAEAQKQLRDFGLELENSIRCVMLAQSPRDIRTYILDLKECLDGLKKAIGEFPKEV